MDAIKEYVKVFLYFWFVCGALLFLGVIGEMAIEKRLRYFFIEMDEEVNTPKNKTDRDPIALTIFLIISYLIICEFCGFLGLIVFIETRRQARRNRGY